MINLFKINLIQFFYVTYNVLTPISIIIFILQEQITQTQEIIIKYIKTILFSSTYCDFKPL